MKKSERAQMWRDEAARRAAQRAAQTPCVPVDFDGFTGRAHRVDLMGWVRAGKVPQYLAAAMYASVKGRATEARKEDLTPDEFTEWLRFQRVIFCEMMDEPRFSIEEDRHGRELNGDELDYAEFVVMCPDVVKRAVQWQLDGCPEIPIQTEGGEMSMEDLTSFRDSGDVLTAFQSNHYGGEGIWWQTQPTPRIM